MLTSQSNVLHTSAYILNCVLNKSIHATSYELRLGKKPSLDYLHQWGSIAYVHNPTHNHGKFGLRATKIVFIRYPAHFKGYIMYGEHRNGGMTAIDSHNVDFLEDEILTVCEIKRDVKLY